MEVFDADPKSVYDLFLSRGAAGYYIPAYQREYSWDVKGHVSRFLEDICLGINTYVEHSDSITFIGSIISIRDTDNKTVKPYVQGHLPSEVMTVIDGQQRVTTMSLMGVVLHNLLSEKLFRVAKEHSDSITHSWFADKYGLILNNLKHTFELDVFGADKNYRFYPKIIRSYVDQWAKDGQYAIYKSPVARFHFEYIKFIHENHESRPSHKMKYELSGIEDSDLAKHKRVSDNVKFLYETIDKLCLGEYRQFSLPCINSIASGNQEVERRFFGDNVPEYISEQAKSDNLVYSALSLVMLANYFLHRVAVTAVVAKNESYAFDMFESLNTTGEPLTAFETFKPRVIDFEGVVEYESSASRTYIGLIDKTLEGFTKAEQKQKATTRLLIPFRLYYEGEKLSKHLSAQRRFLSKAYDDCETEEGKRLFVKGMSEVSAFMGKMWPEKSGVAPEFDEYRLDDKEEVILCLTVLREANHNITIPILARYYSYAISENYSKESLEEFGSVVKAVLSFFVLWRSSRSSTSGIDDYYRELMRIGYSYKNGSEDFNILEPVCVKKNPTNPPLSSDLKLAFNCILENRSGDKINKNPIRNIDEWVKSVLSQPLYSINKPLVRMLILLSSHDTTDDPENPGLVILSTDNFNPMLNVKCWTEHSTIEHIWPKSSKSTHDWDSSLEELSSEDVLGNLTLLPRSENSSAGARSWQHKKLFYQLLSAQSEEERDKLLLAAKRENISVSCSTEDLLKNSKHLPQVRSISKIDTRFSRSTVEERGRCLAEIAWQRLRYWL